MASPIHRRVLDTPQGASASDCIRVFGVNDDLGQQGFVFRRYGFRRDGCWEGREGKEEEGPS